jgi:nitrous oxide reductase accessory protein NosL
MKNIKYVLAVLITLAAVSCTHHANVANAKPYPLKTCLVCGMALGSMGNPYVFVYQGQQIKLCDASEKAIFNRNPEMYMKKIADAQAQSIK